MKYMMAACIGAIAAFCTLADAADKPKDIPKEMQDVPVRARVIADFQPGSAQKKFGALEWVGGLDLTSSFRGFGGFSALHAELEGKNLLAVSDAGLWLKLELETNGESPTGIKSAQMAPLRNLDGAAMSGTWRGDAESLAVRGTDAFVGFEGADVIWRYPLRPDVFKATAQRMPLPSDLAQLRHSRGLESLALFPSASRYPGALLAIGEQPARGEQALRAWIIDGTNFRRFAIVYKDDYAVTDAAFLDNGDVLLLERRVVPPFGLWSRIRRLKGADISAGARVDGPVIFEASLSESVDNMEGLALHKVGGVTYITLISDDNFSILQRTLLLRFKLLE